MHVYPTLPRYGTDPTQDPIIGANYPTPTCCDDARSDYGRSRGLGLGPDG